jgi:DNA topoisomerase-1
LDVTVEKSVELLANRNKRSTELRTIGEHPETGESLVVKDGRFGSYITDGKVNVSLKRDLTPEGVTLAQAVELINQKRLAPPRPKRKRKKKK